MNTTPIKLAIQDEVNAINVKIQELTAKIQELTEDRLKLEQAFAIVSGASPAAQAANTLSVPAEPTGNSAQTKRRKRWKESGPMAWVAAGNSGPWSQHIYDYLEDGRAASSEEVWNYVKTQPDMGGVSLQRVTSSLSHMKQTNRLVHHGQKWRRKYSRQPSKAAAPPQTTVSINPKNAPEPLSDAITAQLEQLANEGKLSRETANDGSHIYTLNRIPTTGQ